MKISTAFTILFLLFAVFSRADETNPYASPQSTHLTFDSVNQDWLANFAKSRSFRTSILLAPVTAMTVGAASVSVVMIVSAVSQVVSGTFLESGNLEGAIHVAKWAGLVGAIVGGLAWAPRYDEERFFSRELKKLEREIALGQESLRSNLRDALRENKNSGLIQSVLPKVPEIRRKINCEEFAKLGEDS